MKEEVKTRQGHTSSCWAFSVISFLESELGYKAEGIELSAWNLVRNKISDQFDVLAETCPKKKIANGGIGNTALHLIDKYGIVFQNEHNCTEPPSKKKNRWTMRFIQGFTLMAQYAPLFKIPCRYIVNVLADSLYGKRVNQEKARHIDISKYKEYTSFCHLPYNEQVLLELPDNFYKGTFYNIPLDDLIDLMKRTLSEGHTFVWDGGIRNDVVYSHKRQIADIYIPKDSTQTREQLTSEQYRSESFLSHRTKDDHMLHVIGMKEDEKGRIVFIAKDSAANIRVEDGQIYLTEDFVRLKTISILV